MEFLVVEQVLPAVFAVVDVFLEETLVLLLSFFSLGLSEALELGGLGLAHLVELPFGLPLEHPLVLDLKLGLLGLQQFG